MSFCAVSNEVRVGWEMLFVMLSLVPQSMLIWNQTKVSACPPTANLFMFFSLKKSALFLCFTTIRKHKHTAFHPPDSDGNKLILYSAPFASFQPVWAPLFGQTQSRSCWQRRSSPGPSWFFCAPHRRAKTECSPRCTRTSGTRGRLSVQLGEHGELWAAYQAFAPPVMWANMGESYLYSWGLCPQTRSKSQHPPEDLWGSNTIYPWKEHQDLSLAQLPVSAAAQTTCKARWRADKWVMHGNWDAIWAKVQFNRPNSNYLSP